MIDTLIGIYIVIAFLLGMVLHTLYAIGRLRLWNADCDWDYDSIYDRMMMGLVITVVTGLWPLMLGLLIVSTITVGIVYIVKRGSEWAVLGILLVACLSLGACEEIDTSPHQPARMYVDQPHTVFAQKIPLDTEQAGVYYFDTVGVLFLNSLASFKHQHPELVVSAIAPDGSIYPGTTRGYFISTERREKCSP